MSTASIYRATTASGAPCAFFDFVWRSCAPPKVKFFAWLLVQNRIQCKANLKRKNVLDDDRCDICGTATEDADHIITRCHFAQDFWCRLGWTPVDLPSVSAIWEVAPQAGFPRSCLSTMLILCCWQLWKHRHEVTFRSKAPCLPRLMLDCRTEARLWRGRLPPSARHVADFWCSKFVM